MAKIQPLFYKTTASGALKAPFGLPKSTSSSRHATAVVPLGTEAVDADGNCYRFVKAGATIAANDALKFNGSALGYDDVQPTSATSQYVIGTATAGFSTNQYGFVQTHGVVTTKVVASTAAGALLGSTGTAGTLGIAVNTDLQGRGACALVTGVAAGSAVFLG